MRRCWWVYGMCAAVVGVACVAHGAGEGADVGESRFEDTIVRLGSGVYGEREAAQRELEKLPGAWRAVLKEKAEHAADLEVKGRLLKRLDEMELDAVLHPTGFTLNLKEAAIGEVVAAVNRQAGIAGKLLMEPTAGQGAVRLTLHTENAPLMEVVRLLNDQSTLSISAGVMTDPSGGLLRLIPNGAGVRRPMSVSDCFLTMASASTGVVQVVNGQQVPTARVILTVVTDPRVPVLQYGQPQVNEAGDDTGANLVVPGMGASVGSINSTGRRATWSVLAQIAPPGAGATKIAKLKGVMEVLVALEEKKIVVEDVEAKLNVPIETPQGAVTVETLQRTPTGITVRVSRRATAVGPDMPSVATLSVAILDAAGSTLAVLPITRGGTTITTSRAVLAPGPMRVELKCPVRVKEVAVPFEFTDIPLARPAAARGAVLAQ